MNFAVKRIFTALATMFLVSVFCFFAFNVIPGDPAISVAGTNASAEYIEMLREEMGLNKNVFVRYFEWLFNFLCGRPGDSFRYHTPVTALIKDRLPVSFALAFLSIIIMLAISIPTSLLTVKKEGSKIDRAINIFTAICMSVPGFFLGLLFIWFFGLVLKIFIPGNFIDYKESFSGFLGYLFFPSLAIAIPSAAVLIKFLRGSFFAELKSDYVRTAKSKGAGRFYIMRHHVLKNAAIPAITMLGMIFAEILAGSIIIEQVFSIPGTGRLLIASITSRDYPLIQCLMVYIAFLVVFANTLADIAIMIIDPRIRKTRGTRET